MNLRDEAIRLAEATSAPMVYDGDVIRVGFSTHVVEITPDHFIVTANDDTRREYSRAWVDRPNVWFWLSNFSRDAGEFKVSTFLRSDGKLQANVEVGDKVFAFLDDTLPLAFACGALEEGIMRDWLTDKGVLE